MAIDIAPVPPRHERFVLEFLKDGKANLAQRAAIVVLGVGTHSKQEQIGILMLGKPGALNEKSGAPLAAAPLGLLIQPQLDQSLTMTRPGGFPGG